MNAFRNLYKIRNANNEVVAFVTAGNADGARGKYHGAGGQVEVVTAEQVSTGYHEDVCTIYS